MLKNNLFKNIKFPYFKNVQFFKKMFKESIRKEETEKWKRTRKKDEKNGKPKKKRPETA
jgi:hypothetical protein